MTDFSTRSSGKEIMDDPAIAGEIIPRTLKELGIINKLLGGNYITISGISNLLTSGNYNGVLHIADMGCGGGDILKLIADWAIRKNLNVRLTGIDANPNIIEYARENTRNYENIEYRISNIFDLQNTSMEYDIVTSTLFLHHFDDEQSASLISDWVKMARIGVIINDIHRHSLAYYSIKILTSTFSRSYMIKNDAPLSVLRAFKKQDLIRILKMASIESFTLDWQWAFRWRLIIYSEGSRKI